MHVEILAGVMHVETHTLQPQPFDVVGPQIGLGVEPVGEDFRLRARSHPAHVLVVGVENCRPVRGQRFHQFRLAVDDRLEAAGPLEVNRCDHRQNAHLRLGDPAQEGDVARDVEAHLQHHAAVGFGDLEDRQGQADFVVQVAFVGERRIARRQDVGGEFLGGGFPDRSGDPDHAQAAQARAPGGGDRLQRF